MPCYLHFRDQIGFVAPHELYAGKGVKMALFDAKIADRWFRLQGFHSLTI